MIKFLNGDLLDIDCDMIAHQVNCIGAMNSGVAKEIREKYPEVYREYKHVFSYKNKEELLGCVQFVKTKDGKIVANLFSQQEYGYDGKLYTNYKYLDLCINKVFYYCRKNNINVAIPYKMSCVRGGGNWEIVLKIISKYFEYSEEMCFIVRRE